MFYSDDLIEEVRTRNDVVDLIGNYIKLTKREALILVFALFIMKNLRPFP